MLVKRPDLLSSSRNGMERRLQFLQARFSLNKEQLSKLVQRMPSLLQYGTDENDEAKLQYLQKRLMLEDKELLNFVRIGPIFQKRIKTLEQKIGFIQNRLLLDENQLRKFVLKYPSLLCYSVAENVEPKLEYFQKRLSMDDEQLQELFIKLPSLFGMSIEFNLEPKITFFESLIGVNAARALLIVKPYVLTRSMEKRIKPRVAEAQEAGLFIDAAALARIAFLTEEKWTASVAFPKKKLLKSKGELW